MAPVVAWVDPFLDRTGGSAWVGNLGLQHRGPAATAQVQFLQRHRNWQAQQKAGQQICGSHAHLQLQLDHAHQRLFFLMPQRALHSMLKGMDPQSNKPDASSRLGSMPQHAGKCRSRGRGAAAIEAATPVFSSISELSFCSHSSK